MPLISEKINFELAEKRAMRLPDIVRDAIEKRYGPHFKENFKFVTQYDRATPIYQSLYSDAYDKGLSKERKYTSKSLVDGQEYVAEPIAMLKRSPALALVNDEIFTQEQYNGKPVQFVSLDIKRFARANLLDPSAGDYLANKSATALREALSSTMAKFNMSQSDKAQCIDFRYGGDEFMVAVVGNVHETFMQELTDNIEAEMAKTQCFFADGKGDERKLGIKLKNIETISVPQEKNEQKVFLTYLQRGIVLDAKVINKIMKMFYDVDGTFKEEVFDKFIKTSSAKKMEYPEGYESIDKKIDFLATIHPEYAPALWLAQEQDDTETVPGHTEEGARKAIVLFIENSIYNHLFNTNVLTFDDILEHLEDIRDVKSGDNYKAKDVVRYFVTLVNNLKDINDGVNPAVGDLMLQELGKIISLKPESGEESVVFELMQDMASSRLIQRGGTLITQVMERELTPQNYGKLAKLEEFSFTSYDGSKFTLPVGSCELRVKQVPSTGKEQEFAAETLNKMIVEAEDVYYKRFLTILNDKNLLERYEQWSEKSTDEITNFFNFHEEQVDKPEEIESFIFLRHFLHGKNAVVRCQRALRALNNRALNISVANSDRWIQILQKIKDKWSEFEAVELQKELDADQ